jgi:hypothetical protein
MSFYLVIDKPERFSDVCGEILLASLLLFGENETSAI